MKLKTILITGAGGQVGSEFQALHTNYPEYKFIFTERNTLDITDEKAVALFFEKHEINICVNCAANTAVDKAEAEKTLSEKVNATAVGYLAKACNTHNAVFIHISTDYVFNGTAIQPYLPDDKTDPVNFYGASKLAGERLALLNNENAMIIRTAWVYSSFGNNFVKTMMRLMKEREAIGVVNDQQGSPTFAGDLASGIMQIIASDKFIPGIYHYTNEGVTTWYGFAKEIASLINTNCIVNPISTAQFPTPAARPAYSVLDTKKISSVYGLVIPAWRQSLKKCMADSSCKCNS